MARAIHQELDRDAEVTVWDQNVFTPGLASLEALEHRLLVSDAGVFVFTPEDDLTIKDTATKAVRDNVVFELGLFIGCFGRRRSFFIVPRGNTVHIPSDLLGITHLEYYSSRADGNPRAAVGPACTQIRALISPEFEESSSALEEPSKLRGTVWVKEDACGMIVFLDDSHFASFLSGRADWSVLQCDFDEQLNSVVLNWGAAGKNYSPRCGISVDMRELREPKTSAGRDVFIWRRVVHDG